MGSETDRKMLTQMRLETDASLMGAGTLRAGDPEMRGPNRVLPAGRMRAIMTEKGELLGNERNLFRYPPPPIIFCPVRKEKAIKKSLGLRAQVIPLPPGPCGLSVRSALAWLAEQGARSVLVEGGGRLNYACLAEGVVDEMYLTITPKLSGDRDAALLVNGSGPLGTPFLSLALLSCESAATGEIYVRYRVLNNEKEK